ncbi:MAG: hypothetical protein E6R04_11870 [Spirochaetes bacterium]|nr:MAG: hypothetical protein E6R04_11870 [Spirochaetota bacterium]
MKIKSKFKFKGVVTCKLYDLEGNLIEKKVYNNLVVNAFLFAHANLVADPASSFTGTINYGAVGTNNASPTITDTQLGTELARVVVDDVSVINNIASINFYFDPSTGNGNLKEFGAFVDGSASLNSGVLFDRVNIDIAKTSLNSLIIQLDVTVS